METMKKEIRWTKISPAPIFALAQDQIYYFRFTKDLKDSIEQGEFDMFLNILRANFNIFTDKDYENREELESSIKHDRANYFSLKEFYDFAYSQLSDFEVLFKSLDLELDKYNLDTLDMEDIRNAVEEYYGIAKLEGQELKNIIVPLVKKLSEDTDYRQKLCKAHNYDSLIRVQTQNGFIELPEVDEKTVAISLKARLNILSEHHLNLMLKSDGASCLDVGLQDLKYKYIDDCVYHDREDLLGYCVFSDFGVMISELRMAIKPKDDLL